MAGSIFKCPPAAEAMFDRTLFYELPKDEQAGNSTCQGCRRSEIEQEFYFSSAFCWHVWATFFALKRAGTAKDFKRPPFTHVSKESKSHGQTKEFNCVSSSPHGLRIIDASPLAIYSGLVVHRRYVGRGANSGPENQYSLWGPWQC